MSTLVEEIREITGVDLGACASCAACRAPVPLKSHLDIAPDDLIRLILDDKRDVVFASKTIWLLSGCMGRSIVCEKGVRLGKALAGVRKLALDAESDPAEPDVAHLLETITCQVRHSGRVHLRGILSEMRRHLGEPATECDQEFAMMLGGKLRFRAQKVKDMPAVIRALDNSIPSPPRLQAVPSKGERARVRGNGEQSTPLAPEGRNHAGEGSE